jgi:hypothetical protein
MTMNPEPNLSADSSSPDQMEESIASLEQAAETMVEIDNKLMNGFRDLLNRYRDELSTDITEIAKGLKISRPLLTEFMNRTGGRNDLPLTPGKIYHLHATLTRTEKLYKKRRTKKSDKPIDSEKPIDSRTKSQKAREKLKEDGADEMLMIAGYLPRTLKMLPVSSQQYSQLSFISFLHEGRPLNPDLFAQIIKQEMDRAQLEDLNPASPIIQTDRILIDRLNDTYWLEEVRESVKTKYEKAIKIAEIAEKGRSRSEKIALFKSILYNQLSESEGIPVKLRVTKIEYISLSLAWPKEDDYNFSELLTKIKDIEIDSERMLGMFDREKIVTDDQKKTPFPIYPVLRTIVTCEYKNQEINLEYVSRGTHTAASIQAVAINLGFHKYISTINVDVKWLGENMKSLVSAIVKIGNDRKRLVSGEWVSSDLLHTIVQATIAAGRKWICQKFENRLSIENYENIIKSTAKIRIDFYENRLIFDRYDFDNKEDSINQFKQINDLAIEWLVELDRYPEDLRNNFSSNFYRVYILSKLYMLQYYNMQVDHKECHRLIREIDLEFYKNITDYDKILVAAKIGLAVEKIAYNISFGIPYKSEKLLENTIDSLLAQDLLNSEDDILDRLKQIDRRIEIDVKQYIEDTKYFSDPGYDIHYSLGSYYLATSRLLFFIGKTEEQFKSAFNRSMQAAYYFQRIGLSRKVQRSIVLAGRISIRIQTEQSKKQAKQCKVLSEALLKQSIIDLNLPPNDTELSLSLKSRLNLLEGEYEKATTVDNSKIFMYYLKSLRGSLWLGLNRHLANILYMLSNHIEKLDIFEIDRGIKQVFPEFFLENLKEKDDKKVNRFSPNQIKFFTEDLTKNSKNQIAPKIVRDLIQMYDPSSRKLTNIDIAKKLKALSCDIWNNWNRNATGDENSSHPFVSKIKEGTFLDEIKLKR